MSLFRFLKNLFVDFLIKTTGTYVGSPVEDSPNEDPEEQD